ncbi:MAG: hypothetical protein Q4F52_11485, partial [Bacteroidaceae bacterium]|nr:hypothetical protein [Bacteroidaceae bacterium]
QAEIDFLNKLYNAVLKSDYGKDADITDLLTNANFGDRSNGWTGKSATNFDTDLYVAECYNNTFNMSQTLKNLKPGVYEVFINGFFRPAGENESRYYTAYLSANDQQVPIMHSVADAIPVEDAVDMENCYITELSGEWPYDQLYAESYYIPGSMQGASYAFKGGRYVNHILVNVEEDSLTIGVRSDGTGCANDWTVFANTKLYYRGTLDEATSAIDNVLAEQAKRANEILEGRVDDIEYTKFPNFSQALRDELKAAIDATSTTVSANEKYELVKTFSALFTAVQDCQKAYVELYAACDMMADLYAEMSASGAISTDEYNTMLAEVIKGYEAFSLGTFTAEEAKAWKDNLVPIEKDGDFYLISDAVDMTIFAMLVNGGQVAINGKLTADIDWSAYSIVMGTGGNFDLQFMDNRVSENDYQGTFDGQGHMLTVNIDHQSGGTGLFAHIGENGKVCNIIIDGTISGTTGVGTFAWENWGTLENCVSLATIRTSVFGFAACGGMTCASHGSAVYKNCIFAGTIEGENANEIAGFNWYAGNAQPIYENCVCVPTSVNVAGYFAWSQQDGNGVYRNCYFTDV